MVYTSAVPQIRIGTVPFANALPLDYYLPSVLPTAEIVRLPPSQLGKMMRQGDLDIALLSTIERLRHPEYDAINDLGICCDGRVRSVCLFSKEPIRNIHRLALDSNSLTSVILLKILLQDYWQIAPDLVSYSPPLKNGIQIADAALAIGDNAFVVCDQMITPHDLGEAWKNHTGLPFVFAEWMARPGFDPAPWREAFMNACAIGLEHRRELAELSAAKSHFPPEFFFEYFTESIKYERTPLYEKGLDAFYEKARPILEQNEQLPAAFPHH